MPSSSQTRRLAAARRRLAVLAHARATGNVTETCRVFGISRDTFYEWRRAHRTGGADALVPHKRGPRRPNPHRYPQEIVERILHLRNESRFGAERIARYLQRYDGIHISASGVTSTLRRCGAARLPEGSPIRSPVSRVHSMESTPGHDVQIAVKVVAHVAKRGMTARSFQYEAIDVATRVRVVRIYARRNQDAAIDFLDHVVKRFPFRIRRIRTNAGPEFQARFHWHAEDHGIEHVYGRPDRRLASQSGFQCCCLTRRDAPAPR